MGARSYLTAGRLPQSDSVAFSEFGTGAYRVLAALCKNESGPPPQTMTTRRHVTDMQSKMIKAVIVCTIAAGVLLGKANAQPNITWQTPATISGTSDVSTQGIYFGS